MKFLYSKTASPKYYNLNGNILLINNERSLQFILPDGESIHYPVPNLKGKITALTTYNNQIILSEETFTIKIHLYTVDKISKSGCQITHTKSIELNSLDIYTDLEKSKLYFNTLPNDVYFKVKDLSLSNHNILAILLPNKVLVLHLNSNALTVSDENVNLHAKEEDLRGVVCLGFKPGK